MIEKLKRYDFESSHGGGEIVEDTEGEFYKVADVDKRIAYLSHGRPAIFETLTPDEIEAAYAGVNETARLQADIALLKDTAKGQQVVAESLGAVLDSRTDALTTLLTAAEAMRLAMHYTPGAVVPADLESAIEKAREVTS